MGGGGGGGGGAEATGAGGGGGGFEAHPAATSVAGIKTETSARRTIFSYIRILQS